MSEPRPTPDGRLRVSVAQETKNQTSPDYYDQLYDVDPAKIEAFMEKQAAQNTRIFDGRHCFMTQVEGNRFFFLVRNTLPSSMTELVENDARLSPVVCITKARVITKDGIFVSKHPVPILVAHGGVFRNRHTISSDQRDFSSESAYKAINDVLRANGLPPIAILLSCDDRSPGGIGTRWDFKHGVPLVSFAGGSNVLADHPIDSIRRKFDKTLEIDQSRMIKHGATLNSFNSSDPAKRALIDGIFRIDPFTRMRRRVEKAFEGLVPKRRP